MPLESLLAKQKLLFAIQKTHLARLLVVVCPEVRQIGMKCRRIGIELTRCKMAAFSVSACKVNSMASCPTRGLLHQVKMVIFLLMPDYILQSNDDVDSCLNMLKVKHGHRKVANCNTANCGATVRQAVVSSVSRRMLVGFCKAGGEQSQWLQCSSE